MPNLVDELADDLEMERDEVLHLLSVYLKACQEDLRQASQAVASADGALLATHAHSIKGASANLKIEDARAAAEALETMGRSGTMTEAATQIARLEAALTRVQAEMNRP